MISFDEAVSLIGSSIVSPLGTETVSLAMAPGRVLAAPVIARIDSPRADVSSMDGYAVRDTDLEVLPVELKVAGASLPGNGWDEEVSEGTCARIFTGAPMPDLANRIVIQELVRRNGDKVIVQERPGRDRYVRSRGSDFAAGDQLLSPGRLLDPRALVAAAAADVGEVEVYRRPRLRVLSTGDELVEPGHARERSGTIPDSVSVGVSALAEQWGALCIGRSRLVDDLDLMRSAASRAVSDADVVVVTGGASVGERDFAKAMFEPSGLQLAFSKIAIRPGKPTWFGRAGNCLVLGLPGNPTSAMVTARLLLAPLLAVMQGRKVDEALCWKTSPIGTPLGPCDGRETFHRAVAVDGSVQLLSHQDSGAQKALADADILVRQRANSGATDAGQPVETLQL